MFSELRNSFITVAGTGYEEEDINSMFDTYCTALDTNDEATKDKYIARIILRFWSKINKIYTSNKNACASIEEAYDILVDAINYNCKYRGWQDPDKNINAQQALNKCISTIILQRHYDNRLDKNKANFNAVSLDAPANLDNSADGDEVQTLMDKLETEQSTDVEAQTDIAVESIVQDYINRNKIVEAIIIDTIAFQDTIRHTSETKKITDSETGETVRETTHYSEFWPYKAVQYLSKLPESYDVYFKKKYMVPDITFEKAIEAVRAANNQKLYKYVNKTLIDLRKAMA